MRITESQLRRIIREALLSEDLSGFIGRTKGHDYRSPMWDPTFELEPESQEKSPKRLARSIKGSWGMEADHKFMDSLTKIHWFKDNDWKTTFPQFMTISGRNEISAMGYLPGSYVESEWGSLGVVVKGRTTLAANSMNAIQSGYHSDVSDESRRKHRSSGIPKRPVFFKNTPDGADPVDFSASDYILDRESFNPEMQGNNELIVDNWKPVGIVFSGFLDGEMLDDIEYAAQEIKRHSRRIDPYSTSVELIAKVRAALEYDLPIHDKKMRTVSREAILRALGGGVG